MSNKLFVNLYNIIIVEDIGVDYARIRFNPPNKLLVHRQNLHTIARNALLACLPRVYQIFKIGKKEIKSLTQSLER